MSNLPSVTFSGLEVSDLFFNFPCANYNQAVAGSGTANEKEEREALIVDAEEFIELFGCVEDAGITPEMLADDYLRRL